MTTTAVVGLPHTGMQAPHDRVRQTGPGLIEVDGQPGQVGIDTDDDFAEVFTHPDPAVVDAFYEWAGQCRTEGGDPLDLEDVFDVLRAEYATDRALRRAAQAGATVVQAMTPFGDGYLPGQTLQVEQWETRDWVIGRARAADSTAGTWWRLFDGTGWIDLEPH